MFLDSLKNKADPNQLNRAIQIVSDKHLMDTFEIDVSPGQKVYFRVRMIIDVVDHKEVSDEHCIVQFRYRCVLDVYIHNRFLYTDSYKCRNLFIIISLCLH